MNIQEFEVRRRAYEGLLKRFKYSYNDELIFELVQITDDGQLEKKLTETLPSELKELTIATYTSFKKKFIADVSGIIKGEFTFGEYIDRLEYEAKVIKEMQYNEYILIVQDFINRAKHNGVPVGPGRGSAAGSLLMFLIGITDVDPIEYGLLFERFLNPARVSNPDVDIDFEDTQRERVVQYVVEKYGAENVANIGTYMKLATKAAFKDVSRTMGIPFDRANYISNLFPDKVKLRDLWKSEDVPDELKRIYDDEPTIKKVIDMATILEDNLRQVGVHACGIIISPKPVTDYASVQYPLKINSDHEKAIVTQLDGKYLEKIGLLKMDFLGLRNLGIIHNCCKIIRAKFKKNNIELPELFKEYFETLGFYPPLDDLNTYQKVLQQGDTSGVFQFEGDGIKNFLMQLKPTDINDIIAMGALYRPGPMEFIPNYIRRKHGEEEVNYMGDELRDLLIEKYGEETMLDEKVKLERDLSQFCNVTYGIVVYQEQLMFMVQSMAGYSLSEADNLRRAVGKKIKEVIEKEKSTFVRKAGESNGYKEETATRVYEKMVEPAAFYSFNKSHAACYGMISYQTAYLKANYPIEFNAALLRSVEDDTDKLSKFIGEIQAHGITLLPPNINSSFNHVAAYGDAVLLGFVCVKGIGSDVGEFFELEREKNGLYVSLSDFLKRCSSVLTKKSLESIIKAGGLDEFGDRAQLFANMSIMLDRVKHAPTQGGGLFGETISSDLQLKESMPIGKMDKLLMEFDVLKVFVGGNPFDGLYLYCKKFNFISNVKVPDFGMFEMLCYVKNIQRAKKKGFFVEIEDISDSMEFFMKDMLDIQKFDILLISGYKGKSMRVSKIVRTSLEKIIQNSQLSGKYDEILTVAKVRKDRTLAAELKEQQKQIHKKDQNAEVGNNQIVEEKILRTVFEIPNDVTKIQKIKGILESYPGNIKIMIGPKEIFLSEEGQEKLDILLASKID